MIGKNSERPHVELETITTILLLKDTLKQYFNDIRLMYTLFKSTLVFLFLSFILIATPEKSSLLFLFQTITKFLCFEAAVFVLVTPKTSKEYYWTLTHRSFMTKQLRAKTIISFFHGMIIFIWNFLILYYYYEVQVFGENLSREAISQPDRVIFYLAITLFPLATIGLNKVLFVAFSRKIVLAENGEPITLQPAIDKIVILIFIVVMFYFLLSLFPTMIYEEIYKNNPDFSRLKNYSWLMLIPSILSLSFLSIVGIKDFSHLY